MSNNQELTQINDEMSRAVSIGDPAGANSTALGPVSDDWHAVEVWFNRLALRTPPVSVSTLKSYRQEIEKLRWYCEHIGAAPIGQWNYQHAIEYLGFLKEQAHAYVSPKGIKKGVSGWTPFKAAPGVSSIGITKKVLTTLYGFWLAAGYVRFNPFSGLGHNAAASGDAPIRSLSPQFLEAVYAHIERRPKIKPNDYLTFVRNRFLIKLLERTGLRANEAVMADMADITPQSDPKTLKTYWSLAVRHGKGGSTGFVYLDQEVLESLKVYRRAFGFSELPGTKEDAALVLSTRTKVITRKDGQSYRLSQKFHQQARAWHEIRRRQTLWDIVTKEFESTAKALDSAGRTDEAQELRRASTHWLRHTFGTQLVLKGKDIRVVAQAMRHKNIKRTMMYTNLDFLDVARAMQD